MNFRLCRYADLYVEGKAHVVSDSFNGVVHSKRAEAIFSVLGGFAVNFGGTRFKSYNPVEEEFVMDAMNAKVNMLRASLDSCKKVKNKVIVAPAPAPVKEVVVEKLKPCSVELTSAVRFAINSSEITSEEMVNVYNVAQWMKNNPDYKVIVTGYADKEFVQKELFPFARFLQEDKFCARRTASPSKKVLCTFFDSLRRRRRCGAALSHLIFSRFLSSWPFSSSPSRRGAALTWSSTFRARPSICRPSRLSSV